MRISTHVSPQLQAMVTRIRELPTEVKRELRKATKAEVLPIWTESVNAHLTTRAEALVIGRTARVAVSDNGVRLQAARVGKSLSGGLSIKQQWQAIEFGGEQDKRRTVETVSRKGTPYTATRRTQRQLRPRQKSGYVAFPAVAAAVPRVMSLWLQTIQRAGHEALEGKR